MQKESIIWCIQNCAAYVMSEDAQVELNNITAHIADQELTIDHLTAGSEAMQRDAANNTITIKMLMAQLAEVNEENRGLRQMLHMEPR